MPETAGAVLRAGSSGGGLATGAHGLHARRMSPSARSPWWVLVFVILAAALAGALLGLGAFRSGAAPPLATVGSVVAVTSGISAVVALLGFLGARATSVGAIVGLGIGLVQMTYVYTTSRDGMADLGALLTFLMLGAAGLVIGVVIDVARAVRSRR
jgi:FtsH-binding integral membrane protein